MLLKRIAACAFSFVLACGLVPVVASAQPVDESSAQLQLEPGTYVEHEALAYVVDSAQKGVQQFSLSGGSDLLDSAETLMAVDGEAAETALGSSFSQASSQNALQSRSSSASSSGGRIVLVRDESRTAEELIAELEADSRVAFAEPNYVLDGPDDEAAHMTSEQPEAVDAASSINSAADLTSHQWATLNTGSMAGISADEAIDVDYDEWQQAAENGNWENAAEQARADMGSEPVVVAVVDTGVDARNPDLAPVMWGEGDSIQALVDLGGDEHGLSTYADPDATSTSGIDPLDSHGTHVAGIIAAAWDGAGTSGVAPNVEIMSVRLDFSTANAVKAFNYISAAAVEGVNVRVANCSWTLGATASRVLDTAIRQMGERGVVSLFASGNSNSDLDRSIDMSTILRDNPYVIAVNSVDPSGEKSIFSCYGEATTDVMAPGGTILSTYHADAPSYMGEADSDAVLYESFDEETRASTDSGLGSGWPQLSFTYEGSGEEVGIAKDSMRFDGTAALAVEYDADAPSVSGSVTGQISELSDYQVIVSNPIDLSQVSDKAKYLSIRYATSGSTDQASVWLCVKVEEPDEMMIVGDATGGFGATHSSWGGGYYQLPDNTDYENFQIGLIYCSKSVSLVGGESSAVSKDATIYFDSIGLGSGMVPYAYLQGTSMASPVAAGVTAVISGMHPDDSAAKLAARVKGAVKTDDRYSSLCSTGGSVTVSGADDPAPVPTDAFLSSDGLTATVRGYFIPEGVEASIGGRPCAVTARSEVPGSDGLVELALEVPQEFEGGEAWVVLQSGSKRGRLYVDFGECAGLSYYQENLSIPDELNDWADWQLVGFAGDLYVLPREDAVNSADASHPFFMKYDVDAGEWSQVEFPLDQLAERGVRSVVSASATTYQGSLVFQITGTDAEPGVKGEASGTYWRYSVDGTWERLHVELPEGCSLTLSGMATDGERLLAFGGYGMFDEEPLPSLSMVQGTVGSIVEIDLDAGEASIAGVLPTRRCNAQVAYRDGMFIVSGGQSDVAQAGNAMGVDRVVPLAEAETRPYEDIPGLDVTYPAGWLEGEAVDTSQVAVEAGKAAWAPAAAAGGFMLVGPRGKSGTSDTYLLSNEAGATPQEYGLNASHLPLLNPTATAYEGKLYVLAATSSGSGRVFAATPVETVPQPGDYVASDPDPEPDPEPEPTTPQPGDGEDPESEPTAPKEEETLKNLADTGDPLTAPLMLLGAIACLAGAALLAQKE